jgi:hypothetical protein
MPNELDVSAEIAGLKLKSPVLISSSELTSEVSLLKDLVHRNIGGIATKTFTTPSEHRMRVRPYQFWQKENKKTRKEHGEAMLEHLEDMQRILSRVPIMQVLKWDELCLQQAAGYHVGSRYSPMELITSEFEFIPRCKQRGIRT